MNACVPMALLLLASCHIYVPPRERAAAAPVNPVRAALAEGSANPAAFELKYGGKLLRFSGVVAATGMDDQTVVEDRRAACAVAAGLSSFGASMQGQPQAAVYCNPVRTSTTRVPYVVLIDTETQGALVCYMSAWDERTIERLHVGEPGQVAGTFSRIKQDPTAGLVLTVRDCLVPEH